MPRAAPVAALLLFTIALAGCFGTPEPVYVPAGMIADGWSHSTNNQTESDPSGNLEIIVNQYGFHDDIIAEIFFISASDIPFFDEHDALREQMDSETNAADVTMTKVSSGEATLDNGQTVDLVEYDIEKGTTTGKVKGKAWAMFWETDEFIAGGVGYATTEYESLLGSQQDDTQWRNVQEMMLAVDW